MTLAEFFDLYGLGHRMRDRWSKFLVAYDWADLNAGLERAVRGADTTATPSLATVRREIEAARERRLRDDRSARDQAQGVLANANSVEELRLFALIRTLHRRGVLWDFVRGMWVAPGEEGYEEAAAQDFSARPALEGSAPTLFTTARAWTRLYGDEPMPREYASARHAVAAAARDSEPKGAA